MQAVRLGSRYLLAERLGYGAMGEVRLAHLADGGDARVAVKLMRPELAGDADLLESFLQEARLLRSVEHPNVVRVLDLVAEGDRLAIVMDYVPGGDLRRAVPSPCPIDVVRDLLGQVADGLAAIHAAGIVHRDLKPENVLVSRRPDGTMRARVTDFGLSHRRGSRSTRHRGMLGTAGYMSPESAKGLPAGPTSDVYALGVMLYELIAGVHPFVADDHLAMIQAHLETPARRPAPMTDPWWELISRMLAKEPDDRPSAAAVADELRKLPSGPGPTATPTAGLPAPALLRSPEAQTRPPAAHRLRPAHLPVAAVAVAALTAFVAVLGLHLYPRSQAVPVTPGAAGAVAASPSAAPATVPATTEPSTSTTTGSPAAPGNASRAAHAPRVPTLVADPDPGSLPSSDSRASFRIDDVVAGSGDITKILITYDGGSQQVKPIARLAGPYHATVTGLVNGESYTFSVRVCNSFGKCADSEPVEFEPFGLPALNELSIESSGLLHRTLVVPPVALNGNPHLWTCRVTARTTRSDRDAPDNQVVSIDGETITWLPHLLHDYTAQETCTDGTTTIDGPVLSFET